MHVTSLLTGVAATTIVGSAAYVGVVTGRVAVDLGVGRRIRPLGPLEVHIAAPREVVFAAATAPYARRPPRAMQDKVTVLERTDSMVLAAHRTRVGGGLVAVTVETVTFEPPARIGFRLVRGPVPHVSETFQLIDTAGGTTLTYTGELGTDLGALGRRWGDVVARHWVETVQKSLDSICAESERRARAAGKQGS